VSPADIVSTAEFRAGLAQRLAEVGLIPPEPLRLVRPAETGPAEQRQAA